MSQSSHVSAKAWRTEGQRGRWESIPSHRPKAAAQPAPERTPNTRPSPAPRPQAGTLWGREPALCHPGLCTPSTSSRSARGSLVANASPPGSVTHHTLSVRALLCARGTRSELDR